MTISDFQIATVRTVDELHLTGGLRGRRFGDGWTIAPVLTPSHAPIGPFPDEAIATVARNIGAIVFGADEITEDPHLPVRIWQPLLGLPVLPHQAADTWGMIAAAARASSDQEYASLARHLSVSLRAAGIRLRDASDQYHRQLLAALATSKLPGRRFKNIAVIDLHLAFHSVIAELASARDYLAALAARRISAPARVDALNRLVDWLERGNRTVASDPFVTALLEGWDSENEDPWLRDLTDYRNTFLHREPLTSNAAASWLRFTMTETQYGQIGLVRMELPIRPGAEENCEALERFVHLHMRMCRLAHFASNYAPYPPEPPHFTVERD